MLRNTSFSLNATFFSDKNGNGCCCVSGYLIKIVFVFFFWETNNASFGSIGRSTALFMRRKMRRIIIPVLWRIFILDN